MAGRGDAQAGVGPGSGKPHRDEPVEAGAIFEAGRTAVGRGQHEAMEGGATAGLEVGFVPHGRDRNGRSWTSQAVGDGAETEA